MSFLKNKSFLVILSIIAFIAVVVAVIPKPINMNLEQIGNGQKSVVFVYDPNLAVSNQQSVEINKARTMIGEQANFLIVDIGDPKSDNFKRQYQATSSDLLFFNANGQLVDRQVALLSTDDLIKKLTDK